eukprot:CAMPEP_0170583490 /NCGR_PEP_ID=MMETSP0224-20130122/8164_1 /TAXON_ID=285029 /ORGANISM="Togula jolla, Strain CCCM 725" /LENGTH=798 /DNA_ID=CAMNT_0010906823 /DNA_START=33 /DNA_END=2430 /DNA_ORIENTATION=+
MAPGVPSRPLEGRLVRLTGPADPLDAANGGAAAAGSKDEAVAAGDGSGKRGRAIAWVEETRRYSVATFEGELLSVSEENLEHLDPDAPEEGGFDLAWPQDLYSECQSFGMELGESLDKKGYCVVQMFMGDSGCLQASELALGLKGFSRMPPDTRSEYLGSDRSDEVAWLPTFGGHSTTLEESGLRIYDLDELALSLGMDGQDALARCDRALSSIGTVLWPVVPHLEGEDAAFLAWARTNGLVRACETSVGGSDEPIEDRYVGGEELEDHRSFMERRKLCMIYVLESAGGTLTLCPKIEPEVTIPLVKNRILIFRHDLMSFSYSPSGRHVALQSWILDMPLEMREREEALRVIDGPPEPLGDRVNVMGIQTRYPGLSNNLDNFWNMLTAGSDTQVEVPITRWDLDIYYRAEHTLGFSMTKHSGLLSQEEVECFDNSFFGISAQEAEVMAPLQRIVLEVGYEALHNAGHSRESMQGWNCGVYIGDSGSDWSQMCNAVTEHRFAGSSNAVTCQRLSYAMGMVGPVSCSETACSSGLVACGVAHMAMRRRLPHQISPSIGANLDDALVLAINTLIGPGSYIALSGPGMLTTKGRCFTFNDTADGYARGEGCGAVKLKYCTDTVDSMNRLAMLIGSAVNQDGRSASMTAPHGPSQQDVIRASMKEAGLSPSETTVAECHGTGTALGDPIEVGALRGVMMKGRGLTPILKTSAKSNIGHLEAGAGIAGLIKCVQMLRHSAASPNCHLKNLNPHLDVEGYPVHFETEAMDFGTNSGITGVSSSALEAQMPELTSGGMRTSDTGVA